MNVGDMALGSAFAGLAGRKVMFSVGEVKGVSDDVVAVEIAGGLVLDGVRLTAVSGVGNNGVLITPKVGSMVLMADLSNGEKREMVVVSYSDIEKIEVNGGNNGGMVNVEQLVERLNAIEDDLNKLKRVFAGWTPVPQDGGSVLKTAAASWSSSSIAKTSRGDIEDELITH